MGAAAVERVQAALSAAGSPAQVQVLAEPAPTAVAAAALLGIEVGQVVNSLVFAVDPPLGEGPGGQVVLVLTSGAHRVDTAWLGGQLGVRLRRADPELVRAATGQPIGGVAPLGHPQPLRTLVDTALGSWPVVWAAGGIPHAVFPTGFEELVRVTGGTPAAVVRPQ